MEESLPFPVSVGLVPTAPSSGITASKKGMARSAILGGWDREFAACGERKTSSGKKRQPPGVCLQASIWKEQVFQKSVSQICPPKSHKFTTKLTEKGSCG